MILYFWDMLKMDYIKIPISTYVHACLPVILRDRCGMEFGDTCKIRFRNVPYFEKLRGLWAKNTPTDTAYLI
jgi:hypothetical protein